MKFWQSALSMILLASASVLVACGGGTEETTDGDPRDTGETNGSTATLSEDAPTVAFFAYTPDLQRSEVLSVRDSVISETTENALAKVQQESFNAATAEFNVTGQVDVSSVIDAAKGAGLEEVGIIKLFFFDEKYRMLLQRFDTETGNLNGAATSATSGQNDGLVRAAQRLAARAFGEAPDEDTFTDSEARDRDMTLRDSEVRGWFDPQTPCEGNSARLRISFNSIGVANTDEGPATGLRNRALLGFVRSYKDYIEGYGDISEVALSIAIGDDTEIVLATVENLELAFRGVEMSFDDFLKTLETLEESC